MEKNGDQYRHQDAEVTFTVRNDEMEVELQSEQSEIRFIVLRWNGRWEKRYQFLGDAFERGYGNLEWRGFDPQRIMPWYFLASDENESKGFGVKVRPNALCFWMCDAEGVTLWLDVRCGAMGVILDGRKLDLAVIVNKENRAGETAFQFAKSFCKSLCDDPLLPANPVYGSNNWYYAYGNSSHEEILRDTQLLAELTEGLENRPFMVIDDCWQELALTKGAAGRPITRGNERFPDMSGLAKEMKAKNVKPGIWIRPLESNEMFLSGNYRSPRSREVMDPSVPEVLALIAEDMDRVTGWGYELVKYDFATCDIFGGFFSEARPILQQRGWSFRDRSKTSAECVKDLYRTIYEHSHGAILIGCNVIGHLAAGYIHLHRSGDDTSGHSFDRTVMMGVNTLAFRMCQHKTFFDMDADCVGITERIPWEENKKFLELLAGSGTPLFVSAKPDVITEEMKQDLKKAFQRASIQEDELIPLDWKNTTVPERYLMSGEKKEYTWVGEFGLASYSSL
jgi:alpha-galactosidase